MVNTIFIAALTLLSIAVIFCLYRLIKGPSRSDRVLALDTIGINVLAMIAVLSLLLRTDNFTEIILLIGILTFIGTTATARYIERGEVMGHDDPQ